MADECSMDSAVAKKVTHRIFLVQMDAFGIVISQSITQQATDKNLYIGGLLHEAKKCHFHRLFCYCYPGDYYFKAAARASSQRNV